jgi:ribosomal subunit interface protein
VDRVDIVVKGRHTAVPERFRSHVEAKLAKLERYDGKVMRVDVELSREHNRRMSDVRERVELTVYTRGPVIRAEAAAADPYSALDGAAGKLAERLRRAAERRVDHLHGNHGHGRAYVSPAPLARGEVAARPASGPSGVEEVALPGAEAAAPPAAPAPAEGARANGQRAARRGSADGQASGTRAPAGEPAAAGADADRYEPPDRSPMLVRTKTHRAAPMTLDDALSNMELVGHDFYLFQDASSGRPSVVYRRRGYDYGVIHLIGPDDPSQASDEEPARAGALGQA